MGKKKRREANEREGTRMPRGRGILEDYAPGKFFAPVHKIDGARAGRCTPQARGAGGRIAGVGEKH